MSERSCRSRAEAGDSVEALRAPGDVEVVRGDADDLAEAEGDDRQVVAAQPQSRPADDESADDRGGHHHGQGRDQRPVALRGQQPGGVRADREERGVPEVEEPAVADHDVQPDGEHHEDERAGHDVRSVGSSEEQRPASAETATIGRPAARRNARGGAAGRSVRCSSTALMDADITHAP